MGLRAGCTNRGRCGDGRGSRCLGVLVGVLDGNRIFRMGRFAIRQSEGRALRLGEAGLAVIFVEKGLVFMILDGWGDGAAWEVLR